jgi:hypothetical protein
VGRAELGADCRPDAVCMRSRRRVQTHPRRSPPGWMPWRSSRERPAPLHTRIDELLRARSHGRPPAALEQVAANADGGRAAADLAASGARRPETTLADERAGDWRRSASPAGLGERLAGEQATSRAALRFAAR